MTTALRGLADSTRCAIADWMLHPSHGWIRLRDVHIADARIGAVPSHPENSHKIVVDIDLWTDVATAANTEDLAYAVDYDAVAHLARELSASRDFKLLESFSERLATQILQSFPIDRVRIETRKSPAAAGSSASVCIERGH